MIDKINLVYKSFPHLGSAYFGTFGLEKALRKVGKLHYAYNLAGSQMLDIDELQKYPILYMRGHMAGFGPLITAGGEQFKATYQSESYFTRHGKMDISSILIRERESFFDMIFTCADSDVNTYKIPTVFCSPWADTNVTYPLGIKFPINQELLFIGARDGREDFLKQDHEGIIKVKQTEFHDDPAINAKRYNDLMGKHFHILNAPGRYYNGVCGRMWEILAAKRLCYQWHNPYTMFKTLDGFKDGHDIVLFSDIQDLFSKYNFYQKHFDEAMRIAENGYNKFKETHTEAHRANFLADSILEKANALVRVV